MRRIVLAVAFAAAPSASLSGATCSPTLFIQAASVPSGGHGTALVVGLIDTDAIPDIAVVNESESSVSVLLGDGEGGFGPPIVTDVSGSVYTLTAADFNGDTKLDLAVGQYGQVLIFLGHGDGTFDPPVPYPTSGGPVSAIVAATFDANASLDLATVDSYGQSVRVLLGNGDGTFGSPVAYLVEGATAITAGDFNGDAKVDLATSNGTYGTVSILIGTGNGTFGPATAFLAGAYLSGIATADLDGNGSLDLLTTSDGYLAVLLGNGNGTFQAALQYPSGLTSGQVATGDFDLDGVIDVALETPGDFSGPDGVAVLHGTGDGSFGGPEAYVSGNSSSGLAVADLNGDGLPDVVSADLNTQSVSVLLAQQGGALFAAPVSTLPVGIDSASFAQSDFNGDGRLDLAWSPSGAIEIALGLAHGRFEQGSSPTIPGSPAVAGVAAGDFTGDSEPDLVASEYSNVWLLPGLGDGTFAQAVAVFSSFEIGRPTTADFNGDGKLDFIVNQGCCGSESLVVLLGNGDGSFRDPIQTPLLQDIQILLVADLTGDTVVDLVGTTNNAVVLLKGNGDGTFGDPQTLAATQGPAFAATGDFDGNGKADLLLSRALPNVELLLGNGDGTFQSPIVIGLANLATALAVADFDGDGNLDFAVDAGQLLVLMGIGNGHFQSPIAFPTPNGYGFLAAGDYDGNGHPDVVSAGGSSLTTLLNTSLGALVRGGGFIVGSQAVMTASASGFGPVTYQWRKNGTPLSDGGTISGVTTATLTIDPVAFTDAGLYDVVVTDSCGTTNSNAATLSVEFDDVPTSSIFHKDIITIATSGITGGCNTGTSYCPTASVSRAEMAVLLLKSKYGADHVPPPPPVVPIFPDVPADAFAAAWIDELAGLQITAGCGDGSGNYCPDAPVTRGQMAVFLLKTLLGFDHVPPPATGIFADVPPDYFSIDWIEDLYNRGITAGCNFGPLRYCPDDAVPREQMATFLVRTFSIGP